MNIGNFNRGYSATGASSSHRAPPRLPPMLLTAEDIARLTDTPVRTVRERLSAWHRHGGPVVRAHRGGRGQPPWAVRAEDYAQRVGIDVDLLCIGAQP